LSGRWKNLSKGNKWIYKFQGFLRQDFCKPNRYTYPKIGRVASTNLRYAKVALDLQALFGNLDGFSVAEIGIGYGGQFHAISMLNNPSSYTGFDLPEVLSLGHKYNECFNPKFSILRSGDFNKNYTEIDLVISNYAFSELNRELQEVYFKNVIAKSRRGYVIYNEVAEDGIDTMSVEEFLRRIPGSIVLKEWPLTHMKNQLVVWGHQDLTKLLQPLRS
jgi:putative sugar O-methyltransferase